MSTGGTNLYCPNCRTLTVQKSMGWDDKWLYSGSADEPGKFYFKFENMTLHVFRRVRECKQCETIWNTYEMNENAFEYLRKAAEKVDGLRGAINDDDWLYEVKTEGD